MSSKKVRIKLVSNPIEMVTLLSALVENAHVFAPGRDVVIADPDHIRRGHNLVERPPVPLKDGMVMIARCDNPAKGYEEGMLGRVVERGPKPMIELRDGSLVQPNADFVPVAAVSYYQAQEQRFRCVVAIAVGNEGRGHLKVAAKAAQDLTVIGMEQPLTAMFGQLGPNGQPDPDLTAALLFGMTEQEWELDIPTAARAPRP